MVEIPKPERYLFENLVINETGSTINVSPSCITHYVSPTITWQYPAKKGYRFEKIDSRIVLKKISEDEPGDTYISCRVAFEETSWNLPYFFNRWYFYSICDVHKMNMRGKLTSII